MNCEEYIDDLLPLYYGELPAGKRAEVEDHLDSCDACQETLEEMKAALGLLRDTPKEEVPEMAFDSIIGTVRQERAKARPAWRTWGAVAAGFIVAIAAFLAVSGVFAPTPVMGELAVKQKGYAVTVFNVNMAMVKDSREIINLRRGITTLEVTGIPAAIKSTSVTFVDLDDPGGTKVLEQNYEFDLASAGSILAKFKMDDPDNVRDAKTITLVGKDGFEVTGALLYYSGFTPAPRYRGYGRRGRRGGFGGEWNDYGYNPGWRNPGPTTPIIGLRMRDGSIRQIRGENLKAIRLGKMPANLRTKPTLVWKLEAKRAGLHQAEISYLTGGMNWNCDYRVTFQEGMTLDLSGWVTITNFSGVTFPNAKLKLIAGDVNIVDDLAEERNGLAQRAEYSLKKNSNAGGFVEKSFGDYHLYTLQGTSTLKDQQTKQIELINVKDVKWNKLYEYHSNWNHGRPLVHAQFINEKKNNLGMPLPMGKMRMFAIDRSGEFELAGIDRIDHTPRDEKVKLRMGYAFDIIIERKMPVNVRPRQHWDRRGRDSWWTDGKWHVVIKVRNHKDKAVEVDLYEHLLRGHNIDITKNTQQFNMKDAFTVHFPVKVPAGKEVKVEYHVRYSRD